MKKVFSVVMVVVFFWAQIGLTRSIENDRTEAGLDFDLEQGHLDPVEFLGTLVFSSFRGVIVDGLWVYAQSPGVRENIGQLPQIFQLITSLQPTFVESSIYAAEHLAFDVSAQFYTPEEKWYWYLQGKKIFDKAIDRNEGHPKIWKLRFRRGQLLTRKIVHDAIGQLDDRQFYVQKYIKEFGREPYLDVIDDYKSMIPYEDVPGGLLFMCTRAHESYATATTDPEVMYHRLLKAMDSWNEITSVYPSMKDRGTRRDLEAKIAMAKAFMEWQKDPDNKRLRQVWIDETVSFVKQAPRDYMLQVQMGRYSDPQTGNYLMDLMLRQAHDLLGQDPGKAYNLAEFMLDLVWINEIPLVKQHVMAINYVCGLAQRQVIDAIEVQINSPDLSKNDLKRLKNLSSLYKKRALSAYKRAEELLKENPSLPKSGMDITLEHLKSEIERLENKK